MTPSDGPQSTMWETPRSWMRACRISASRSSASGSPSRTWWSTNGLARPNAIPWTRTVASRRASSSASAWLAITTPTTTRTMTPPLSSANRVRAPATVVLADASARLVRRRSPRTVGLEQPETPGGSDGRELGVTSSLRSRDFT